MPARDPGSGDDGEGDDAGASARTDDGGEDDDAGASARSEASASTPAAGGTDDDPIEVGVELLAKAEDPELSLADAMDRVEAVSTAPTVVREILDTAEKRGVVEREDGVLRTTGSEYVSQTTDVVRRDGDYDCRRCGTGLSTGHFVQLDAGELGPFGSECVRKVTGRDD
jgi:hypothetical protein